MTSLIDTLHALSYRLPVGYEAPKSVSFRDITVAANKQTDTQTDNRIDTSTNIKGRLELTAREPT